MIDGAASTRDDDLDSGDAVKIEGPEERELVTRDAAELMLVDVPLEFEPGARPHMVSLGGAWGGGPD